MNLRRIAPTLLLCAAVVATPVAARAISDSAPPALVTMSLAPLTVDTTSGPATLSVAFSATDDLSGVKSVEVTVGPTGPGGTCVGDGSVAKAATFAPATSRSGTIDLAIPLHAPSGSWKVCNFTIADATGNSTTLSPGDFDLLGVTYVFTVLSDPDTTPPSLLAFGPLPASVDTTSGSASFDVPASVTDDLSGLVSVTPIVGPSSGGACTGSNTVVLENVIAPASLASSAPIHFEIPAFQPADEPWAICEIELRDAVGNVAHLDTAALAALGFPTTFGVVSTPDTTPPTITSFAITPDAVDTDDAAATLTISWSATDDLSGVQRTVVLLAPAGCSGIYQQVAIREVAGSTSASESFQLEIPRWSPEGPWEVCALLVLDVGGNYGFLDASGLAAAGWSPGFVNAVCGDGVTSSNESCDDGAANGTQASCCSTTCQFVAADTACTADTDPCTSDACTAGGSCEHPSNGQCVSSRSIIAEVGPSGATVTVPDGSATLVVPPGAVAGSTQVVLKGITATDLEFPTLEVGPDGLSFLSPASLSLSWPDAVSDGNVDGLQPLVREAALAVSRDGTPVTGECRLPAYQPATCGTSCCDQAANTWTVPTSGAGTFAMIDEGCGSGISAMRVTISKLQPPAGDEALTWQGNLLLPPDLASVFDPRSTGLRLQLDDGAETVLDVLLPAAKWTANRAVTSWKFSPGKTGPAPAGIGTVVLKADKTVPGLVKFVVKGKNGDYTVGAGLTAKILVDGGECFAAGPDAPPPTPSCSFAGTKLLCR